MGSGGRKGLGNLSKEETPNLFGLRKLFGIGPLEWPKGEGAGRKPTSRS